MHAADGALAAIEARLKELGLYDTTNIIVATERGLSTLWKETTTSATLGITYKDEPGGKLPSGFLAIDLAAALREQDSGLTLYDPDDGNKRLDWWHGGHPQLGNAIIAVQPFAPYVTIEAKGGHDLIYFPEHLPKEAARKLADLIARELFTQDYVSGVFVNEEKVGSVRGALSMKHLGWEGGAGVRLPEIVVNFVSVNDTCRHRTACTEMIADTPLPAGMETSGEFSRTDTWNFIAARGPAFRKGLISQHPASNADVIATVRALMRVDGPSGLDAQRGEPASPKGQSGGRVLTESLRGRESDRPPHVRKRVVASKRSREGYITEVHLQAVGPASYFVAGGTPGWTVGVPERPMAFEWRPWLWDWLRPKSVTIAIGSGDKKPPRDRGSAH